MQCRQTIVRWLGIFMLLILGIIAIPQQSALALIPTRQTPSNIDLVEVSPPETIQKLRTKIDQFNPQVKILSPAADQLIKDDTVSVQFEVQDLPIFKDASLGLGPHLNVFLDNNPSQEVYDLNQPLIFKELTPGTHTIRAVASRPWFESFKNSGAYAQTTFHIFTQTDENQPSSSKPLLTYGQPQGILGTEIVLLDFYLSNLPKTNSSEGQIDNWQALVSVNGSSFYVNDWQPLYIKGLKPGKNWVRFELTDRKGRKIENAFSDTIRIIEVRENGKDTLSKLIRGDLSAIDAGAIVDPHYKRPPTPPVRPSTPQPSPTPIPAPESKVVPIEPPKVEEPKPETSPDPATKQPKEAPAIKAAPLNSLPKSKTESPAARSVSPPKLEKIKPKGIEEKPAQESAKKSTQTQADGERAPKVQKDQPSSLPLKPVPSQLQEESSKTSAKRQITEPQKTPPSQLEPLKPALVPEKDRKPATTPVPSEKLSPSPSKLKNQDPKPADKLTSKTPAANSTSAKKATPSPSPVPVKPKTGIEDPAPVPTQSAKSEPSVTLPSSPGKTKATDQDESSSLQATFTKFWNKVRPSQDLTTPSPLDNKESVKKEEQTPNQIPSSTSAKTTSPKNTTKSSPPDMVKQVPSASVTQPSKPRATNQSKSSTPGNNKTQTSKEQVLEEVPEKAQPLSSPPAAKSAKPAPSIFSSLQDRWQQQKQSVSLEKKEAAPATPLLPKTTDKTDLPVPSVGKNTIPAKPSLPERSESTNVIQPTPSKSTENKQDEAKASNTFGSNAQSTQPKSVFSSLRDRWQQQKQLLSPDLDQATSKSPEKIVEKFKPVKQIPAKSPTQRSASKNESASTTQQFESKQSEPKPSTPASQPESIFSSFRDRWQQQKTLVTPPQKEKVAPVPSISSPTSSKSTQTDPQSPSNALKQLPSRKDTESQQDAPPPQTKVEKSDPVTFDPGVFYRRLLSKDEISNPKMETEKMSPTPSS